MFDLNKIDNVSIGVLGDLAIDIYWYADMKKSELSRETPHYPLPVVREVASPGAAGNVVCNIAALKPENIYVCGVCSDDWRGELLRKKLADSGADISGVVVEEGRFTQAYCKPMRMGISDVIYEDPRLDFSSQYHIKPDTEDKIIEWLNNVENKIDYLCVCDQFEFGVITPKIIKRLECFKVPVAVDSRERIEQYRINGILKPNELECTKALKRLGERDGLSREEMCARLIKHTGASVFLTLGEEGSLFVSNTGEIIKTSALLSSGPTDICGAGDTTLSALVCALSAGADFKDAAEIASAASAVTVRKIGMTGNADRNEIEEMINSFNN